MMESEAVGGVADPEALMDAIYAEFGRRPPKPLALAEEAVRAVPGNFIILSLAATAALLEERPDRAQLYLKRITKRFNPSPSTWLLQGLLLAQQKKLSAARELLKRHVLLDYPYAMAVFPGGTPLSGWLSRWLALVRGDAPVVRRAAKTAVKAPPPGKKPKPAAAAPVAAPPVPAPSKSLARLSVSVPVEVSIDMAGVAPADALGDPAWFGLRGAFIHLGLAQGFDELLCLPHLHGIETYWHQVETVRKVLKQFHGRVLLADEVGLGKTIEACMVLKEYLLRGMVDRVLILVPAPLVGQWREELETKFAITCASTHDALLREDPDRFWSQPRIVASLAVARRREHAARLTARSWDAVVVDEAHHLRDRASQSYKLVDALTKRFLLLLSATPVQNSLLELYNLLTLLKPGVVKTQKEFRAAYMAAGKPPQPSNPDRLRGLMRNAMIRNTRAVAALRLPRRHATMLRVDGGDEERACYEALDAAVRGIAADGSAGRHRMALRHLLSAAGSSPAAASAALRGFAARHGRDTSLTTLADRWARLAHGAKEAALLDLLRRNPAEKVLVFVHHRETLNHLAAMLETAGIGFARFAGDLSGPAKDAAIAAFREDVPVLLCTESGGEGRNLQFCNTLVNFDIPWNPMAIEQRIGRIDRIGQQREVFVFNLATRGTLEDEVLRILDEKINMFELVVGEVGAILGELEEEHEFGEMVLDAWLEAANRGEAFAALGDRLTAARRQYDDTKTLDDALFGEGLETA
ncbi:MAG: DEAD/DEAH box helicase family protein [Alphaproteobacteria bacterium]|nr:DEAD/DEAH box helicase family protein [Alphaproteobacteria bacterium]